MSQKQSTSSLLQLQRCLPLSCTCQSSGHQPPCPEGGLRERAGDRLSAAQLSGPAQLEAQAHCLSVSFQVIPINILFSPLSCPWPLPRPSAPRLPPWIGRLPLNTCFISCLDGYLGTAAPATHWTEQHTHLIRGVIIFLSQIWSADGYRPYPLLMVMLDLLAYERSVRSDQKRI